MTNVSGYKGDNRSFSPSQIAIGRDDRPMAPWTRHCAAVGGNFLAILIYTFSSICIFKNLLIYLFINGFLVL